MELRRYLGILRRRLWLVLALVLVGGVLGDLSSSQKASYSSVATIYIGASSFNIKSSVGIQTGADQQLLASTLIPTYSSMLQSQPIAVDAARRAGFGLTADDVLHHVKVANQASTTLLTVTATESNPTVAQAVANSVADAFTTKIQTLQPQTGQGAVPQAPAYIFQRGKLPTSPLPTKTVGDVIKGALIGFVLAIGLSGLLEYLDVTVKGPNDAEERLDLAVLGVIPLRRTNA